jgi:hypothetical protein
MRLYSSESREVTAMSERWNGVDRRQHPRVSLEGELRGRIHTVASAPVINLSMVGALLEVPCTLQVGALYTMRLVIDSATSVDIKGKVVRSYVHGFHKDEKGETVIKYRAAVQFQAVPEDRQTDLEQFIQGMGNVGLGADLSGNPAF